MKFTNSFFVVVLGILVLGGLGYRGADVVSGIVGVVGSYVLGRAGQKASNVWAASKDANADTLVAIEKSQ